MRREKVYGILRVSAEAGAISPRTDALPSNSKNLKSSINICYAPHVAGGIRKISKAIREYEAVMLALNISILYNQCAEMKLECVRSSFVSSIIASAGEL